jgi:hypothetical protein
MATDYIPHNESDRRAWLVNFANQLSDSGISYGFTAPEVNAVSALVSAYDGACGSHIAAVQAAQAAKETKDDAMTPCLSAARDAAGRLQSHPLMDDAKRVTYGLTVRDAEPSPQAEPPLEPPQFAVDVRNRLQHVLRWGKRPPGMVGMEIYRKVDGPTPTDLSQCEFVALDTASPYMAEYTGAQAGKTVWYILRWAGRDGVKGPISETVAATVAG